MKKYDERIIGQPAYEVNIYDRTLKELVVTGFTVDKDGYRLTYNPESTNSWARRVFLSKRKATNFLNNLISQHEKKLAKLKEANEHRNLLREATKNYKHLIGKEVVVKVQTDQWVKDKITDIDVVCRPSKGSAELSFRTRLGSGYYLFVREGKNWKWWSKLDELKDERAKLLKKIDSLNKQVQDLDSKILEQEKQDILDEVNKSK